MKHAHSYPPQISPDILIHIGNIVQHTASTSLVAQNVVVPEGWSTADKADPLTALGLAANIVQFITFASSLVSKTSEILNSAHGSTLENTELKAIAKNLLALNKELVAPKAPRGNDKQSRKAAKSGEQLRELCTGCEEVAQKLLSVIQKLEDGKARSKLKSLRQALLSVWKEGEIAALSKRLERFRSQIDTALLLSLGYYIQEREPAVDSLAEEINKGRFISRSGHIKRIQLELAEILESRLWQLRSPEDVQLFSSKVSETADCARQERAAAQIFESLRFQRMESRFEHIPYAYRQTFDWVFHEELCYSNRSSNPGNVMAYEGINFSRPRSRKSRQKWDSFTQWLRGDETLYWITGKPGSGKSTLMKYLSVHPETMNNLASWTGTQQATHAGFFFWNSGAEMQMSEMGLFQTLLYKALEATQNLIPTLFPERWKRYKLFGSDLRPWSLEELSRAFEIMVSDSARKFFFFIDGLDEFDGDEERLAKFALDIASSRKNVKMCVASRPWLVFEDSFHMRPSLRLEDLTAPDIQNFVSGNLGDNRMYSNLQKARPREARELVLEITGKACGVFLWVHLVVLSLREGLRDGDSINDLRGRLLLLPSDLENLFEKIIRSVSPRYLEQACMIFQCIRTSIEPLSLLDLSLTQGSFDKVMVAEVKAMDPDEMQFRAETMRRHLNSRCRGLIEAPDFDGRGPDAKVQYLHRTVRDFLATRADWEVRVILEHAGFRPDLALCGGYLFHLKVMSRHMTATLFLHEFWRMFERCLRHFDRFRKSTIDDQRLDKYLDSHSNLINELQRIGDELFDSGYPDLDILRVGRGEHSLHNHSGVMHWHETLRIVDRIGFKLHAVEYELLSYFKSRLKAGCQDLLQDHGHSLLQKSVNAQDFYLVELLLKHGVDPNCHYGNESVWQNVMAKASEPPDAASKETSAAIVELFLKHGARRTFIVHGWSLISKTEATLKINQPLATATKSQSASRRKSKAKTFPALQRVFRTSPRGTAKSGQP